MSRPHRGPPSPRRVCHLLAAIGLAVGLAQAAAAARLPAAAAATSVSARAPHCPYDAECLRVRVPLDWSGRTPGSISLNVEVGKGPAKPRGVMFLVSGGPGQAATQVFDVSRFGFWSRLLPGYTLVAFDDRGTGSSGPLACPQDGQHESDILYGAICARLIGTRRAFYSTADNAMDIDAVRRALGYGRISILGVSYGTDLALAYAAAFPGHVGRIVLDSVSGQAAWPDVLAQLPATLREYCLRVCAAVTSDFGADVVGLANALERHPVRGTVLAPDGGRANELLTAQDVVYLAIETDLDPALAAALPAAVQAARHGVAGPLLRLERLVETTPAFDNQPSANAVYAATDCDDGPFPWQPDTPLAQRPALFARSIAAVSSASIGGFGRWALAMRSDICLRWPPDDGAYAPSSAAYPNVPVLVIAGELDARGTMEQARAVADRFRQGRLVTLANVGHSAITAAPPGCLDRAIARWLGGRSPASHCSSPRVLAPLGAYPPIATGDAWARPASALELAAKTLREAEATWLLTEFEQTPQTIGGLVSGRLHADSTGYGFTLHGYGIVDGLELTGKIDAVFQQLNGPPRFSVGVIVKHGAATVGELVDRGQGFDGTLDGRRVVAGRLGPAAVQPSSALDARGWSTWAPPAGSIGEIAGAIAAHVQAEYRLSTNVVLDRVSSRPLQHREGGREHPVTEIDVETATNREAFTRFETTNVFGQTDVWSYELCGAGPGCTIRPGQPSLLRGQLVRREGLELALYTFTFDPTISGVVVTLPPAYPAPAQANLLYFRRSQLATELGQPLRATLPLARPPLPTSPDPREQATIVRETVRYDFDGSFMPLPYGESALVLNPAV